MRLKEEGARRRDVVGGAAYLGLDADGRRHELLDLGQGLFKSRLRNVSQENTGALLGEQDRCLKTDASDTLVSGCSKRM